LRIDTLYATEVLFFSYIADEMQNEMGLFSAEGDGSEFPMSLPD
jgi:hypothetical protein